MAYTAAIIGAAGYMGQEALDRVLRHPELELVALGSDSLAGEDASALDIRLNGNLPSFVPNDAALDAGADLVFVALSNPEAAALEAPASGVVIDLSGAHRLADVSLYDTWYGFAHPRPDSQSEWCYALPELQPPTGRLIANPGCYVTAAAIALGPLKDSLNVETVVVDAKSGVSGAGRTPSERTIAGTVLENVSPYKVGEHQHLPELAQVLGFAPTFVPHMLPIRRGLLATCYVDLDCGVDAHAALSDFYADAPLVHVLPAGVAPEIAHVQHTDEVELGVFTDRATGRTIVIAAEDNLGKGGAGQAVQNANLALELEETLGLRRAGVLV
jgi:N-acetyl-gamma-glutamyl-phosphate reductase